MRYFFHVRTEEGLIPDDEGTDLQTIEQAKQEAIASARDLANEFPHYGTGASLKSVEVVDEVLRAIFSVPIFSQQP